MMKPSLISFLMMLGLLVPSVAIPDTCKRLAKVNERAVQKYLKSRETTRAPTQKSPGQSGGEEAKPNSVEKPAPQKSSPSTDPLAPETPGLCFPSC